MDRIQVIILGITAAPGGNAFALILKELDGNRRLPIMIGTFEAQSIAFELEGITPPRPMTHDLIKIIFDTFGHTLAEVVIDELHDGTFHAKLIFDNDIFRIDCRPSDAIAIAVRINVPIYISEDIFLASGKLPSDQDYPGEDDEFPLDQTTSKTSSTGNKRLDIIQVQLNKAIDDENYELAAKLRDEIKKILEKS
jgi:bifunctional DNase/RNase